MKRFTGETAALLNLSELVMRLREAGRIEDADRLVASMPEPETIATAPPGSVVRIYVADKSFEPVSVDCIIVEHLGDGRLIVRPTGDEGDITTGATVEVRPMHVATLARVH